MFTVYQAVEQPTIELSYPLIDNNIDVSEWVDRVTDEGNIIVKPKMTIKRPDPVDQPITNYFNNNNDISFEELIKRENLPVRITSSFRGYGTKTAKGKLSNHGRLDEHGNSMAYDIVPLNGDFNSLLQQIYSNKNIVDWFKSKGWGILEETTPSIMKQTKATGKHLHIGPDPGAIKMFNNRLAKAANGMKVPFTEYKPTIIQEPEEDIVLDYPLQQIKINDWASGIAPNGNIIVKPKQKITINNSISDPIVYDNIIQQDKNLSKESKAVNFFVNKNLSKEQAVGIVANLMQESKLNPNAINKKSGAYGIAQWLGDRKKKLFNKYGNNPTFEQQLEYVWEELNSSEKNALDRLLDTKSHEEATHSIMNFYERPSSREKADSIQTRLNYANSLMYEKRSEV